MDVDHSICFNSLDRIQWLKTIIEGRTLATLAGNETIYVELKIQENDLRPEHITSLACLFEELINNGKHIYVKADNEVTQFLKEILHFGDYWNKGETFVNSSNASILNLWKVNDAEVDFHSKRIGEYFRRKEFEHKDLTALSGSILEVYYNVVDHSNSKGNAFSFISYDEIAKKVNVSVCDFGRGIADSVKSVLRWLTDAEAIKKAMEPRFTIRSESHNGGYGLDTIKSSCTEKDTLWIISNGAALVSMEDNEKTIDIEPKFNGTLVFYSISLEHLPELEIEDEIIEL